MTESNPLYTEATLGSMRLPNRIAMAPMTRCRATPDHVPTPIMAEYYAARAGAGLLITEGTAPHPNGAGYARIPGIYNRQQVAAWQEVTDAVHRAGGHVFMQLMHTGRASHPANLPAGARVVAPSPVALTGTMWTDAQGMQPYPVPQEMTEADIEEAIQSFVTASKLAIEAGFDGVELHGANGYLIDQFLNTASNRRTDRWGGAVENRIRFVVEIARRVTAAIGASRVGLRVSPYGVFNDQAPDPDMDALYTELAKAMSALKLVYIHVVDHSAMGAPVVPTSVKQAIRSRFKGAYVLSGGYDLARANADLAAGLGELVAFGRPFISNPDLVARMKNGIPLADPDPATFYTPGEKGYADYAVATA